MTTTGERCPLCGGPAEAAGQVSVPAYFPVDDFTLYECPTCLVWRDLFGARTQVMLTWRHDVNGLAVDPVTGRPLPEVAAKQEHQAGR
jgi:hypothetical protein